MEEMSVSMLTFNKAYLSTSLNQLPAKLRTVFAALCAERQLPASMDFYRRIEGDRWNFIQNLLSDVWSDLEESSQMQQLEQKIDRLMRIVPQEDDYKEQWSQKATNAQNAGMTLVYVLRTMQTGDVQEAIWSAQVAYEALDNWVINSEHIDINVPGAGKIILAHSILQAELQRQRDDLRDLLSIGERDRKRAIFELRERAVRDSLIFFGSTQ